MKISARSKFYLPLLAAAGALSLLLTACSSSEMEDVINKTHGAIADDGATYGSGPNNTKPYPQSEPVNLNGVGGAEVKYEPLSRGGNKNYTVLGKNYQVWRDCSSYLEIGTASWYGPGFHGNKTSNGEVYNQKGYSAAHKNLPLPSYLKVTNLENGKAVVRVRDKGCGIPDIKKAMEPLYTTGGEERAGLGFAVMQSFMDTVRVRSALGKGTTIVMTKKISRRISLNA